MDERFKGDRWIEFTKIAGACLKNSQELIGAAKMLLEKGISFHIAYHLAALALEEIGKITLLGMKFTSEMRGAEPRSSLATNDHIKKLFWAVWAPMFGHVKVTRKQIDEVKGMAARIHNTRLRSLYVDTGTSDAEGEKLSDEEVRWLVDLAENRVALQAQQGFGEIDDSGGELGSWFAEITENDDSRKYIFGNESMDKLEELQNGRKWIEWLRERFVQRDAEVHELVKREMARGPVFGIEALKKRWKVKTRLYSASHSIRKKAIRRWNDMGGLIRLESTKDNSEMIFEVELVNEVPMAHITDVFWGICRSVVWSLNIGTSGFFWWYLPREVDDFCREIVDLENHDKVVLKEKDRLSANWDRQVLGETEMTRVCQVLPYVLSIPATQEEFAFSHYGLGLGLIAKNDVLVPLFVNAFDEFLQAVETFLMVNRSYSVDQNLKDAVQKYLTGSTNRLSEVDDLIQLGLDIRQGRRRDEVTLKRVVEMKDLVEMCFMLRAIEFRDQQLGGRNVKEAP